MADEELTELSPMERAKRVAKNVYSDIISAPLDPIGSRYGPIPNYLMGKASQFVRENPAEAAQMVGEIGAESIYPPAGVGFAARDLAQGYAEDSNLLKIAGGIGMIPLAGPVARRAIKGTAQGAKAGVRTVKGFLESDEALPVFKGRESKTIEDYDPEELLHRVGSDKEYSEFTYGPGGHHPQLETSRGTGYASGMYALMRDGEEAKRAVEVTGRDVTLVTPPVNPYMVGRNLNMEHAYDFLGDVSKPMFYIARILSDYDAPTRAKLTDLLKKYAVADDIGGDFDRAREIKYDLFMTTQGKFPASTHGEEYVPVALKDDNNLKTLLDSVDRLRKTGRFRSDFLGKKGGVENLSEVLDAASDWSKHKEVHPLNIVLSRRGYDGVYFEPHVQQGDTFTYGQVKFPPITADGKLAGVASIGGDKVSSDASRAVPTDRLPYYPRSKDVSSKQIERDSRKRERRLAREIDHRSDYYTEEADDYFTNEDIYGYRALIKQREEAAAKAVGEATALEKKAAEAAERKAKMTPEEIEAEEKETRDFIRRYVFGYGDSE